MNHHMKEKIHNFLIQEDGATMVEYVLILLLVSMAAFAAIKSFGQVVNNQMGNNNNSVANAIQ